MPATRSRAWVSLLTLLFWLPAPAAHALPPEIPPHQLVREDWAVTDGLPQITVMALVQDPTGYLWVATQDGLARFDGFTFENFRVGEHPGLNHNYSNALAATADGSLWIGSTLGLARHDGERIGSLTPAAAPTGAVHRLLPAADDAVWVGAENGLFHAQGDALRRVGDIGQRVTALQHAPDGRLVVALGDRLLIDPDGERAEWTLPGFDGLRSLAAGSADGDVWLWVGGDHGLVGFDAGGRLVRRPLRGHDVEALLLDRDGTLWIASDDGLWRMPAGELPQRAQLPGLGDGSWIRTLLQDRDGNLWVGTHTTGLVRLRGSAFRRIGALDGLTDGLVWSLHRDADGTIWAGTSDGIYRGGLGGFRQPFPAEALPHPMALAFLRDRAGTLWIGTREGLARWPAAADRPRKVDGVDAMIYSLHEDADGRIWVGSRAGVQRIDGDDVETLADGHGLPTATARSMLRASDGRLWIGTDRGAFREQADGTFAAVGIEAGLDGFHVHMLRETRPGEIMLAMQGGLARATLSGDSVRIIGESDGLHTGTVMQLQVDAAERLWYATHEGIGMLPLLQIDQWLAGSRTQLEPQVFGRLDEPQPAQCNGGHGSAGLLADGRWLWCPSLSGALVLDLDATDDAAPPPQPVIQALRSGDALHPLQDGAALPLGVRDLQIDFAGLHLGDPAAVRHAVQLVGYDDTPSMIGERRSAFYTNLPPGDYRFEVQAMLGDGPAALPPATLAFRLPPTMVETRWFQALLLLAGVGAALALFRWRLQRVEQQRRMLSELVRQRTAELEDANRKLVETSVTDPLTGLRNRRYLVSEIPQDVAQVNRTYTTGKKDSNRDLLFLMIDLDHFKQINDRHGHHTGDQVLVQFAEILDRQVRECDYIIRWGGEEFLVIGRQADREHSSVLAERIVDAVRRHRFETDQGVLRCTCSVGIAVYPPVPGRPGALSWEETVELADAATYVAKQEGRDRWAEIRLPPRDLDEQFIERFRSSPRALADSGEIEIVRGRAADVAAAPEAEVSDS